MGLKMQKFVMLSWNGVRSSSAYRKCFSTSSHLLEGRACPEATKSYLKTCGATLSHTFHKSNLTINPLVHGPPPYTKDKKDIAHTNIADPQLVKVVIENHVNCVYVYNNYSDIGKEWHSSIIPPMLKELEGYIDRKALVTVAGLGYIDDPKVNIMEKYKEICQLTGLEHIDILTVDTTLSTFVDTEKNNIFIKNIELINELCKSKQVYTHGLFTSFEPYCYHCPPFRESGRYQHLNGLLESDYNNKATFGDLMIYNITPTTSIPATIPMLDPNPDDVDPSMYESQEKLRTVTRASINPFLCYPGLHGYVHNGIDASLYDGEQLQESMLYAPVTLVDKLAPTFVHTVASHTLDQLAPSLASSKLLSDKVLRTVFSVGIDVVIVDSFTSAHLEPLSLLPSDILTSAETDDVFGNIHIPSPKVLKEELMKAKNNRSTIEREKSDDE